MRTRSAGFAVLLKVIPIGQGMLRRGRCVSLVEYHHLERNHQGLCNALITPPDIVAVQHRIVGRRSRLGGILSYYEGRRERVRTFRTIRVSRARWRPTN
jgi:hypothetical protein